MAIDDSLFVYIPINVTADLGVAMKRVRSKRIAKFRKLHPELYQEPKEKENDDESMKSKSQPSDDESNAGDIVLNNSVDASDVNMDTMGSTEVRREQFGSMVDYLEAKYARGVMIHDLDERIREKKKKADDANGKDDDLNDVLSDSEAGSCYSEDSGDFIDDSDLRTDVAHQILASSAFGTTKIEAEAAKGKKTDNDDDSSVGEDDHAFFVNIGDLEMEDGWEDDIDDQLDWLNSMKKTKGKKRKRSTKSKDGTNEKDAKEKKAKKQKEAGKKTKKDDKSKKGDEKKKAKDGKSTTPKKKKDDEPASPKKKSGEAKSKASPKKSSDTSSVGSSKKAAKVKTEDTGNLEEVKKERDSLKRKSDRLHKKCIEEIEKMTKEHLPRKLKGGNTKCQIKVPANKKGGDEIQIENPHIPGQKLKLVIPSSKIPGDKFTVMVPLPEVIPSAGKIENKPSKEFIVAIDKYSAAFDEWCTAEGKYKALKGDTKYKIGAERLKKYDKMIPAFPKNLEVPIEASFLRLLVRRKRQNQSKRKSVGSEASPVKSKKSTKTTKEMEVPIASTKFPTIKYNKDDFVIP